MLTVLDAAALVESLGLTVGVVHTVRGWMLYMAWLDLMELHHFWGRFKWCVMEAVHMIVSTVWMTDSINAPTLLNLKSSRPVVGGL